MVFSTFYHNLLKKAQAHHDVVPENCGKYKRLWENWSIIVTKVTTTDGDSESNTSYRANPFLVSLSWSCARLSRATVHKVGSQSVVFS